MSTERLTPTSYLVLGLLAREGPSTPYDLEQHVRATLGNFWSFPHTLLYTEPPRLAALGLVSETREGSKQTLVALKKAFPDLRYTIEDSIESGDKIVHRLTASGTMKADFAGMPATGKHATWTEIHIGRVVNGRLTEHWGLIDQLAMLVQLGVIQSPARVPVAV